MNRNKAESQLPKADALCVSHLRAKGEKHRQLKKLSGVYSTRLLLLKTAFAQQGVGAGILRAENLIAGCHR